MAGNLDRLKQILTEIKTLLEAIQNQAVASGDLNFSNLQRAVISLNNELRNLWSLLADLTLSRISISGEVDRSLIESLREIERSLLSLASGGDIENVQRKIRDLLNTIGNVEVRPQIDTEALKDTEKVIDDVIRSISSDIRLKPGILSFEDVEEKFSGFSDFLRNLGIEVGDFSDNIRVSLKDAEKAIYEFRIPTEFGDIKIYYRDDLRRFSTDLRELQRAFSDLQLEEISRQFENALDVARRRGFDLGNLKSIEEVANGVTRLTFEMVDNMGVTRRMIVYQNALGDVLLDNQKRFLSFTDAIVRNTLEAARWAFAITVVYRGLRSLGDAVRDAIETQEKLASVAVVMGRGSEAFEDIFDSASRVADALGMKIGDVLDAYVQAFRAAGAEAENFAQRVEVAGKVLQDSMVLARIAGIEAAEAMDLLVATARQMNQPLTDTTRILDKWVFLSRESSVMVQDFAEAFAIAGAIATSVGVSFDEMSGLVAALAETTSYSGREIGNILRSLFSNIQSDRAEEELLNFGIAVRHVDGTLRDFDDILLDISERFRTGIISEDELARIGRALGGGARRGPQFVTLIKNLERARELTQLLTDSNIQLGLSYTAVDVKTSTVQANINRMSNAFNRLAVIAGERGGVLDSVNKIVSGITLLTNTFSSLIDITGPAGLLAVFGQLASTFSKSQYYTQALSRAVEYLIFQYKTLRGVSQQVAREEAFLAASARKDLIQKIGSIAPVAIASALTAEGTWASVGGALGAIIGGMIGNIPGAVIGGIIGQVAGRFADDMARTTEDVLAPKVQAVLIDAIKSAIDRASEESKVTVDVDVRTKELEEVLDTFQVKLSTRAFIPTIIPGDLERFLAGPLRALAKTELALTFGRDFQPIFADLLESEQFRRADTATRALSILIASMQRLGETRTQKLFGLTDEQIRALKEYVDLLGVASAFDLSKPYNEAAASISLMSSGIDNLEEKLSLVKEVQEEYTRLVEEAFIRGEISAREYSDALERIKRFQSSLVQTAEILGDEFIQISDEVSSTRDVYERFAKLVLFATDEELKRVQALILAYQELSRQRAPEDQQREFLQKIEREIDVIEQNIARRELKLPRIISEPDLTREQLRLIYQEAARLQEEYIRQAVEDGLVADEDALRNYFESVEPVFFITKEGITNSIREGFEGVDIERFWSQAMNRLKERGLLPTSATGGEFTIKTVDITSAEKGRLYAALERAINKLATFYPYFKFDPRPIGIVFKDNVTDILHTDLTALNLALQELVEVNKKQLDGIYNLPEGATFWVPWEAWQLAAQSAINARGGGWRDTPPEIPEELLAEASLSNVLLSEISGKLDELKKEAEVIRDVFKETSPDVVENIEEKVTSMLHGPVSNIDEQMANLARYLESKKEEEVKVDIQKEIGDQMKEFPSDFWMPKLGELLPAEPRDDSSLIESVINDVKNFFEGAIDGLQDFLGDLMGIFKGEKSDYIPPVPYPIPPTPSGGDVQVPDINFKLDIENNTSIALDGQVVAAVVKKYILQDILRIVRGSTISRNIQVV